MSGATLCGASRLVKYSYNIQCSEICTLRNEMLHRNAETWHRNSLCWTSIVTHYAKFHCNRWAGRHRTRSCQRTQGMPPRCSLCTPGQGRKTPSRRGVRTSLLKGGACVTIIVYPLYIHPLYTLYSRICTYMHPLYMCIPIGTPYIHLLHTSKHPIYTPHTPLHGSNFGPASLSRTSTSLLI